MNKFTQGIFYFDKRTCVVRDDKGEGLCELGFRADYSEDEANGLLFSAAPELLEALQDARFMLYGNGPGNPKIDAAIAKALGEE